MTTLAANKPRVFSVGNDEAYPVAAATLIYEGMCVGEDGSGYARPMQAGVALTPSDPFLGFASAKADNSAGAAGAINVEVKTRGRIQLDIANVAITANDHPAVYASDDGTFTLTSTDNQKIGVVSRWVSTGVAIVDFDAARP